MPPPPIEDRTDLACPAFPNSEFGQGGQVVHEGVHDEEEGGDVDGAVGEKLFEVPSKRGPRPDLGGVEHLQGEQKRDDWCDRIPSMKTNNAVACRVNAFSLKFHIDI